MQLKMESTIADQMLVKQIYPSEVPPIKIQVKAENKKSFWDQFKLWE
jgi:hypothetical protein